MLPKQPEFLYNRKKNTIYVEANIIKESGSFQHLVVSGVGCFGQYLECVVSAFVGGLFLPIFGESQFQS